MIIQLFIFFHRHFHVFIIFSILYVFAVFSYFSVFFSSGEVQFCRRSSLNAGKIEKN